MNAEDYINNQNFNYLTKKLHSWRKRSTFDFLVSQLQTYKDKYNSIQIIDFGSGTCDIFGYLVEKNFNSGNFNYLGLEINDDYIKHSLYRFKKDNRFQISKKFNLNKILQEDNLILKVFISLETFEHLIYSYRLKVIEILGKNKHIPFFITVPNELGFGLLIKNLGSKIMGYSQRFNEYGWKHTLNGLFFRIDKMPTHVSHHMGFDWRALQYELKQYTKYKTFKRYFFLFTLITISFRRDV